MLASTLSPLSHTPSSRRFLRPGTLGELAAISATPVSPRRSACTTSQSSFVAAAAYPSPSGRIFEMQLRCASVRPMRGIRGIFRYEGSPLLVPDLDALVE